MGRKRGGIPGLSFSWKRATGVSAAKAKLSRQIGIPLTKAGRQRKVGRAMGCAIPFVSVIFVVMYCSILHSYSAEIEILPHFNVAASCDDAARDIRNNGDYETIYKQCIDSEQKAYIHLKSIWAFTDNRVVNYCNIKEKKLTKFKAGIPLQYYVVYDVCITYIGPGYFNSELDRQNLQKDYKFKW